MTTPSDSEIQLSTTPQEPQPAAGQPQSQQSVAEPGKEDGDKPLGPGGESALRAEREARKALETQLAQFKAEQQAQQDRLAEAFGLKKDAKSEGADVVAELQKQMAGLQHNNLVLTIAGENKITDQEDLELLRATSNEDTMRKLAARLAGKAAETSGDNGGRRQPRPDPSQGRGGSAELKPGEAGRAEAARRFAKKEPSNT